MFWVRKQAIATSNHRNEEPKSLVTLAATKWLGFKSDRTWCVATLVRDTEVIVRDGDAIRLTRRITESQLCQFLHLQIVNTKCYVFKIILLNKI